jgi:hypothetical protein
MKIDKAHVRQTLIDHEVSSMANARTAYRQFVANTRLDGVIETDDLSQAAQNRTLAEQYEIRLHAHAEHKRLVESIDFADKSSVEEGAIVKLEGQARYLVISLATDAFTCQDLPMLGTSLQAPLAVAMDGLEAGESFDMNEKTWTIQAIH